MSENATLIPSVTWRHVEPSPAIADLIGHRAQELTRFADRIIGCEVVVEAPQKRKVSGRAYEVRVILYVPGPDITASRQVSHGESDENLTLAVNGAFSAVERQLRHQRERMSGHEVKQHPPILHGVIEVLESELGWGKLRADDGREVFFEKDSLEHADWDSLARGMRLRFRERMGEKGPYATGVSLAE